MAGSEETIKIGGKAVQLFTGGAGAPLLYLHGAGVYWWMPAHELVGDGASHVADRELTRFACELRMEDDLEEQVAEFFG